MSDLQSKIAALSPGRRALLESQWRTQGDRHETEPIQPRSGRGRPPLSFGQLRLWFLNQWEPGNSAYNTARALRIDGPLDPLTLDRSLTEISRRHETLRTTFVTDGETPVQIVHPAGPVAAKRVNLTGRSQEQKDEDSSRLMAEEGQLPFDLVTGPIWRATLVQLEPEAHLLLLTVHHIVFDGWSADLLYRELWVLYEAFAAGLGSPLAELPIQVLGLRRLAAAPVS